MATEKESTTVVDKINQLKKALETESNKLLSELERLLAKSASTYKLYVDTVGGVDCLKGEQFTQSLKELGLTFRERPTPQTSGGGGGSKTIPSVKNAPLAIKICEILKSHGKPMDAAAVITAVGKDGKSSTVKQYLNRLVSEGVLYRPSRGLVTVK